MWFYKFHIVLNKACVEIKDKTVASWLRGSLDLANTEYNNGFREELRKTNVTAEKYTPGEMIVTPERTILTAMNEQGVEQHRNKMYTKMCSKEIL